MFRKFIALNLMAILSLVLVACGGADANSGGASNADIPALSQTLSSEEEALSFSVSVPEGWESVIEAGQIIASTSQTLIEGGPEMSISAGDMLISLSVLPAEMAGVMVQGDEVSATAIAQSFLQFMVSDEGDTEVGEVESITVGDAEGARVRATQDEGVITLYALEREGAYVVMVTGAAASEADSRAPLFEAILQSVTVTVNASE